MDFEGNIVSYRHESFGGIILLDNPKALAYVDKQYMLSMGFGEHPIWKSDRAHLSAPTEAHLVLTDRCEGKCRICFTDSKTNGCSKTIDQTKIKNIIDDLAESKVFFVALDGGEILNLPWIFDLVEYIRSRSMAVTTWTSGQDIDSHTAAKCRMFDKIWVAMDTPDRETSAFIKGSDGFDRADEAIRLLLSHGGNVGINAVMTRYNFDQMAMLAQYASENGIDAIRLTRLRPSGRGVDEYESLRLTKNQAATLALKASEIMHRFGVRLTLDCAFGPMIFSSKPDIECMTMHGITGCQTGDSCVSVWPDGSARPCAFFDAGVRSAEKMNLWWDDLETFSAARKWKERAVSPCDTCDYFELCRGGCRSVTSFLLDDSFQPDPECPIVRRYRDDII